MKKYKCIALLIYLFTAFYSNANEFLFSHINIDNELSHPSATSIYQDKLGQIWFGNKFLNVYADNTLRTFCLSDYLPHVKNGNIHSICGDGQEVLYLLANNKLVSYDIRQEQFADLGIHTKVIGFFRETLHYGLRNKIFKYTTNDPPIEVCSLPDTLETITALLFHESSLWIGTDRALYQYSGNTLSYIRPFTDVSCLFSDSKNNLWVGTSANGADKYDPQTKQWTAFKQENALFPLISNQIRCINEDRKKNIWMGTYKGLSVVSATSNKINHITYNGSSAWSLSHSSVYAICRDQQGGMWIGTYYGGIDYFNPETEQYTYYGSNHSDPSALHGFIFGNMTEDAQGNIYIGTENGGVNILNKQTHQISHLKPAGLADSFHTVKAVCFDQEFDRLFIGTFQEGLMVYTPANRQFKRIQSEWMTEKKDQIILQLKPWNHFIIVLTQGGVFKLNRQTLEISPLFPQEEKKPQTANYMHNMLISHADQLWIASSEEYIHAINLQTGEISYPDTLKTIIDKTTVHSMCEDKKGRIYFVVDQKGIVRYDPVSHEVVHYNKESGQLLTDQYLQILLSPAGKLLATFNNGITLLDTETKEVSHTLLNRKTPLSSLNINCGIYVSPLTHELFIGGIKGLISLKEENLSTEKSPYELWFSELSVNNEPISAVTHPAILGKNIAFTQTLEVAYNQNNLSFDFATSNYSSDNNLFRYKLEGLDKEWTPARHYSFTYTALPPGTYNLIVQESGNSEKQISMKIIVHPPFYASAPAILLYITLFILLLVYLIRFNRSRAALKVSLEMEHREKERIEELNQIKLRFFTNISHEIRTPITLISSQLEMVLMNHTFPTLLKKKLNKIYKHTLYIQELITEILDFRRQEQKELVLHVAQKDMVAFLKEIFNIFTEYAEIRKVDYRFEVSEEELNLWFDPIQMKKVVVNLLSNAFKHTPSGGQITLSVNRHVNVEIIVSNTGCGIPEDQYEQIFNRFYQVDNQQAGSGSGIGLALTRGIILQHQGLITVSSTANAQTQFKVILLPGDNHFTEAQKKTYKGELLPASPLSLLLDDSVEEEFLVSAEENLEKQSGKKYSILLVEDNVEVLSLLEEAFEPVYRVYKAPNGEEGLKMACELIPDLIVSDVMMPRLSGYELCRQLKNKIETSHIPILLLTAKVSPEQEFEGLSCGADSYITKPFNLHLLLLKCNNFMKSRQKLQAYFLSSLSAAPTTELATNRMDQKLLEQSVKLIEDNLADCEFNIDRWCSEIGISRSKLYAKIKAITGLTLNDFILQIKLSKSAEWLIASPELSISEISWRCGFATPGYFGKCFKNRYHLTPGEYRNNKIASNMQAST